MFVVLLIEIVPGKTDTLMKVLKHFLVFLRTSVGFWLVITVLVMATSVQTADLGLISQWPGWSRGPAQSVAVRGNFAWRW